MKQKESKRAIWLNPVNVGILAALLGFIANLVAEVNKAHLTVETLALEKAKAEVTAQIDKKKFESDMILKAVSVGDREQAIRNLKFFLEAGFISDANGRLRALGDAYPTLPEGKAQK
jgi:hypothetical protein